MLLNFFDFFSQFLLGPVYWPDSCQVWYLWKPWQSISWNKRLSPKSILPLLISRKMFNKGKIKIMFIFLGHCYVAFPQTHLFHLVSCNSVHLISSRFVSCLMITSSVTPGEISPKLMSYCHIHWLLRAWYKSVQQIISLSSLLFIFTWIP